MAASVWGASLRRLRLRPCPWNRWEPRSPSDRRLPLPPQEQSAEHEQSFKGLVASAQLARLLPSSIGEVSLVACLLHMAVWQVQYVLRGVSYWWDYPADVCEALEGALTRNEMVEWTWAWDVRRGEEDKMDEDAMDEDRMDLEEAGPVVHKEPRMSHYVLDPVAKIQTNRTNSFSRPMRRVITQ